GQTRSFNICINCKYIIAFFCQNKCRGGQRCRPPHSTLKRIERNNFRFFPCTSLLIFPNWLSITNLVKPCFFCNCTFQLIPCTSSICAILATQPFYFINNFPLQIV